MSRTVDQRTRGKSRGSMEQYQVLSFMMNPVHVFCRATQKGPALKIFQVERSRFAHCNYLWGAML